MPSPPGTTWKCSGRCRQPICEPEQRAKSLIPNQWLTTARDPRVRESAHRDGDRWTVTVPYVVGSSSLGTPWVARNYGERQPGLCRSTSDSALRETNRMSRTWLRDDRSPSHHFPVLVQSVSVGGSAIDRLALGARALVHGHWSQSPLDERCADAVSEGD
jgi:hypothetical protein